MLFPSGLGQFTATVASSASRDLVVILLSSRVLRVRWLGQLFLLYPSSLYLYSVVYVY